MIISEISYHLVLFTNIRDYYEPRMKADLAIIIPDILVEYGCALERLAVAAHASIRLKRLYKKLDGFKRVFREDYYFKTGKKPTKGQLDDFIKMAKEGI